MAGSTPSYRGSSSSAGSFAGIRRFFRWWWRELSGLVPASLKPLPRPARGFIWVEFQPAAAVLRRFSRGRLEEVGRVELAGTDATARKLSFNAVLARYRRQPIGLAIPADQILRKQVTLPLAARDNLRQVIGFELGRHTPFNAEHACFDYQELGSDPKHGTLSVRLTVAARRTIDESIALLRDWGRLPKAAVAMDELAATPRYANLLPLHLQTGTSLPVKLAYALAALVPLLLLAAALAIPVWQKSEVAVALEADVAQARKRAAAIDALRQELDRASAEYQFLLEKKMQRPATVAILEDVTRLLPDDTWLNQLEVKGQEVILSGETNSSSSLVRVVDKSRLMEEASFRSPLVKGRNNVERFQLAAKLKQTSLADALAAQRAAAEEARKKVRPKSPARKAPAGKGAA
jgi:general secretion pathway protein L